NGILPALREAPEGAVLLADGFSCRTQADQLASFTGVTLGELLTRGTRERVRWPCRRATRRRAGERRGGRGEPPRPSEARRGVAAEAAVDPPVGLLADRLRGEQHVVEPSGDLRQRDGAPHRGRAAPHLLDVDDRV